MKQENMSLIKDLLISILIVICIILIFSVMFYNKISINKVIPEVQEYYLPTSMQEDINQVTSQDDKPMVTTYYIDATELKKYESTKEYNKGKKNPFALEIPTNNTSAVVQNNAVTQNSNGFYEDDGTK